MVKTADTVEEAFRSRLVTDELINFSIQDEITKRAAEVWVNRERVRGKAAWIPAPVSGIFGDNKDVWAVENEELVEAEFPYIFVPAVDTVDKLLAIAGRGLELKREGKRSTLVTNFPMEQRMERKVKDFDGKLHGVSGIEMPLLEPVVTLLAQAFPRGMMHVDGHSLGLENFANMYGLPVLTLTSTPKLIKAAFEHRMVQDIGTVALAGDVGGVMMMNMVAELAGRLGLGKVETVYGEKRSKEMFKTWGKNVIKGKQVFFGDDVIGTGKTVFTEVLPAAFEAGANNVLVFVPHADMVQKTLENLSSVKGDVKLVVGDTFPIRPEMVKAVAANNRLLRVPVFESVMKAAEMDAANLLTDVFTNEDTQAELLRQTGLGIFPPYVARYRTVDDMLK